MDDSFLPSDEMERMRREIDILKKKQGMVDEPVQNNEMKESMMQLSKSLGSLTKIFKEASEEMKMDTHDAVLVSQKLDRMLDRLDKVEAQNEKIAKGVVAVADMIEEMQAERLPRQQVQRMQPQVQQQNQQQNIQQMPQGMQSFESKPLPTYNMPPEEEKRKPFMNFKI